MRTRIISPNTKEIILSAPTAKLMQVPPARNAAEHVLDFLVSRGGFVHHNGCFDLTLFPAGHIFGSAMVTHFRPRTRGCCIPVISSCARDSRLSRASRSRQTS